VAGRTLRLHVAMVAAAARLLRAVFLESAGSVRAVSSAALLRAFTWLLVVGADHHSRSIAFPFLQASSICWRARAWTWCLDPEEP
jgi:hypothetical protein